MTHMFEVDGVKFRAPLEVADVMIRRALVAGWIATTDDYLLRRAAKTGEVFPMDRLTKTSPHGVVYQLRPVIRPNGKLCWQLGTRYFVEHFYPGHCEFFDTVGEALAAEPW